MQDALEKTREQVMSGACVPAPYNPPDNNTTRPDNNSTDGNFGDYDDDIGDDVNVGVNVGGGCGGCLSVEAISLPATLCCRQVDHTKQLRTVW